ncbi:ParA family protein [Pyrobaculum sp. 3827-6]|uniref:ParA family protein n=1 Tax=Pyrobaculum sp. 3827-6 TaxID=2983604 RepID=UPI0021DB7268|nr:ParA family protein [Pyrobaculum sp. 3827-6]MCU7788857.1 ParA family protein [Pyrobaculum sp. 3827-6]
MRTIKTVAIYSLDGGVGKTTLATVMSIAKGFTLVIDADWEKAELSQLFRVPRRPGWVAPFLGKQLYVHQVNPTLYVLPGYDAVELYQKDQSVVRELELALLEWVEYLPQFVDKMKLPVDTVVIDTTPALRTELLQAMQKLGLYTVFVGDGRMLSKVSDVKAEQYNRYTGYASAIVINQVDRAEVLQARRITPYVLRHVGHIRQYHADAVAAAILRDRENRRSVEELLTKIKS